MPGCFSTFKRPRSLSASFYGLGTTKTSRLGLSLLSTQAATALENGLVIVAESSEAAVAQLAADGFDVRPAFRLSTPGTPSVVDGRQRNLVLTGDHCLHRQHLIDPNLQ
ncbi:hypothetical protein ACLB90_15825 [Stenotrophomonas sp. LGBM10]|uniref:hypothetical protein n=1 Tax=Stenotrophomonas sp. LGBM10 TaxID=3390038 RepID=UPI00398A9E04